LTGSTVIAVGTAGPGIHAGAGVASRQPTPTLARNDGEAPLVAYDEELADLVRMELGGEPDLSERKMFGGVGLMVSGNLAVGVNGNELMVRVGPDAHDEAVAMEGVRIFDGGARPMRGWVLVDPEVVGDARLTGWIERGRAFAASLPAK